MSGVRVTCSCGATFTAGSTTPFSVLRDWQDRHDGCSELRSDLDAATEALADLIDRKNDYPTDLDPAHEWRKAFAGAMGTLASLEGTGYGPADGVDDARLTGFAGPIPKEAGS